MTPSIVVRTDRTRILANRSRFFFAVLFFSPVLSHSSPPNPGDKPKPTPLAYARNSDKDDTSYLMINFCQGFMNRRSMADAVTYGKAQNSPGSLELANYDSRAQTFFVSSLKM